MIEILKNVKTISFTYMSIIVLLLFAVLQSDQAVYDSAISQLRQIVKISASHDQKAMVRLIGGKLPRPIEMKTERFMVEKLGLVVEFHYQSFELDYGSLEGKFEIDAPIGFDFRNRININKFPSDFTNVASVKNSLFDLPPPTNITSYKKLHNQTLTDVIIPLLIPDFSTSRFEVYQVRTDTDNPIENTTTLKYEGYRILDPLPLHRTDEEASLNCRLGLMMTVVNDNYTLLCNIGNITLGDVTYSGGRILVPAKYHAIVIEQRELKQVYSIPKNRQISFNDGYRELYETTEAYSDLDFAKIEKILESEKSRNPSKLTIFGAEISVPILTKTVFPILICPLNLLSVL